MNAAERYRRAVELFHRVSAVPVEERDGFLRRECGDDADLLDEVRSLLAYDTDDDSARGIIGAGKGAEWLAVDLFDEQQSGHPIPDRIGKYTIRRLIGHGGMGAVYEAEQENPRRRVALKVVRPGMSGPQLVKRLQREAQVLGRLQHPGIAQIHEAGFADVGGVRQPFFAMEFVDGLPLDAFAKQRGLCARARLELIARTCDAAHHAHEQGVIHRDLKPGNICVIAEANGGTVQPVTCGSAASCGETLACCGQPKVLDFGVARLTDADRHLATLQTEVGQLVGTLSYMSPEQIGGRSAEIDRRSDVYSLGVVLHELLTGEVPHDIREQTIPDAARIIRDEEPSRLGSIDTRFRGDVETIVAKALEKDPRRRYQTAAAMAADLRRYLQDQPIRARPASNVYQLRKFARRHKALVASTGVTLVVLLAGMVTTSWLAVRETSARRVADRAAYRASLAAATAGLRDADVATARRHLDLAPPALRGWLWQHLDSRLDESLRTSAHSLAPIGYTDRAESELWFWENDRRVSYLQRAGASTFVETFDVPTMNGVDARRLADAWPVPVGSGGRLLSNVSVNAPTIVNSVSGEAQRSVILPVLHRRQQFLGHLPEDLVDRPPWRRVEPDSEGTGKQRMLASPTGRWMLVNDASRVEVHALDDPSRRVRLDDHPEGVSRAVFSIDDRYVYSSGFDRTLACFDLHDEGRRVWRRGEAHRDAILGLAISPDGTLLASVGEDRVVRLWDAATGAPRGRRLGHVENIFATAFSASGELLATSSARTLKTWRAIPTDALVRVSEQGDFVESLSFSATHGILLTAARGNVRLWDAESGVLVAEREFAERIQNAAILDSAILIHRDDELEARDLLTRRLLWRRDVRALSAARNCVVVQPADQDHALVLDPMTGRTIGTFPERWVSRAGASVSGSRVAFLDPARDAARIYDVETQDVVGIVPCSGASGVFLLDQGSMLAIAHTDRTISVVDLATSRRGVLRGHTGRVLSIAEFPGRPLLFSAGLDRTIRVWDLRHMEEIGELREHTDRVTSLLALPDERTLFSGSHDYTVRRWSTVPARDLDRASHDYEREAVRLAPIAEQLVAEPAHLGRTLSEAAEDEALTPRQGRILRQLVMRELWRQTPAVGRR